VPPSFDAQAKVRRGHDFITHIAGAHADNAGANGGYSVVVFKTLTLPTSFPYYLYASWYQRADDAWVFGGDNNFKTFAYSFGHTSYEMPNNWYTGYGLPYPSSRTSGAGWGPNDDGQSLMNPDERSQLLVESGCQSHVGPMV
jgi:hypothetical protein